MHDIDPGILLDSKDSPLPIFNLKAKPALGVEGVGTPPLIGRVILLRDGGGRFVAMLELTQKHRRTEPYDEGYIHLAIHGRQFGEHGGEPQGAACNGDASTQDAHRRWARLRDHFHRGS